MPQPTSRLNKRLVELGLASSRRKADELIKSGAVLVDGQKVTELGTQVSPAQTVSVHGETGNARADIYVAYYKPAGEVCSHMDERGAKTIFQTLPESFASLKIAGRLDKDSEGLLILSSDGSFTQAVTHPSAQKEKEYVVTTKQKLSPETLRALTTGVKLEDGPSVCKKARQLPGNRTAVVLTQGRKRQIRRMFKTLGYPVIKLERIRVGNYRNDQLLPGKYVFIKPEEVL